MAYLETASETLPPPSSSGRHAAQRAFGNSSFHWCLALLAAAASLALLPLWAPVLLASWMAVAIRPLHAKLARRAGGRGGAAAVITVLLVVVALLPVLVIGLSLAGMAMNLVQALQGSSGLRDAWQTLLSSRPTLARVELDVRHATELIQRHGGRAWSAATQLFGAASAGAIGVFVFVYGFYACLVDGQRFYGWLLAHSPIERWQTQRLAAAYTETGRGLLIGVGLTALLQGSVATLGYVVIGVPQALVFGLLTALAALIPSIGTGLVWVPLSIGLFVAGDSVEGAAVVVLGCVISLADNVVRPLLSRRARLELPNFPLLVAMLGGILMFGGWGLLAGPLFVRLAVEALRIGRERRELGRSGEITDPASGSSCAACSSTVPLAQ